VTPVADRKGHDRRYSLDDRALRALGYAPRVPFAEGLAATVRWYADHHPWREPQKRPGPVAGSGREPQKAGQSGPAR
jgi:dTDP-glucose 4,6-dehydratase